MQYFGTWRTFVSLYFLLRYLIFNLLLNFANLKVLRDLSFRCTCKSLLLELSIPHILLTLRFELSLNLQHLLHVLLYVVLAVNQHLGCLCAIHLIILRLRNVDPRCNLREPLHLPLILVDLEPPL